MLCKASSTARTIFILLAIFSTGCISSRYSTAAEPEWTNRVLKVGQDREKTNELPITERPYRPLHFYGNTVRRRHYRGTAVPNMQDFARTLSSIGPR